MNAQQKPVNYWDYIRVEDLLALQGGIEDDEQQLSDHEVLFITVHQIFELWFKLALREVESLRDLFALDPVPETAMAGNLYSVADRGCEPRQPPSA